MKKVLTLCIIIKDDKILLGMKKRGFGVGRWNGFGGKVEEGESIEDGVKREIQEESGLRALSVEKVGILDFEFENDPKILEVHIFSVKDFEGKIIETEEMSPKWFKKEEIPFEQMWSDDIFWIPLLLENKKFKGRFLFDRPSDNDYNAKIIEQELLEIDSLE